jgi:hypothetical protein
MPCCHRETERGRVATSKIHETNHRQVRWQQCRCRRKSGGRRAAYDERGDAADAHGGVAAEVEVGGKSAEDGGEVGGAAERVEHDGGADVGHVEDGGEVHHQVRRRANAAQLLERLVADHERHRLPPPVPDLPPGGVPRRRRRRRGRVQRVVVARAVIVDREDGVAVGRVGVNTGAGDGGARHRRSSLPRRDTWRWEAVLEFVDRPRRVRQGI